MMKQMSKSTGYKSGNSNTNSM